MRTMIAIVFGCVVAVVGPLASIYAVFGVGFSVGAGVLVHPDFDPSTIGQFAQMVSFLGLLAGGCLAGLVARRRALIACSAVGVLGAAGVLAAVLMSSGPVSLPLVVLSVSLSFLIAITGGMACANRQVRVSG